MLEEEFPDGPHHLEAVRGAEPAARLSSHCGGVEPHVLGERLRFLLAEGDELPESSKVLLVGDGVERVAHAGESPPVESAGLAAGQITLEYEDKRQSHDAF